MIVLRFLTMQWQSVNLCHIVPAFIMECHIASTARQMFLTSYCIDKHISTKINLENVHNQSMATRNKRMGSQKFSYLYTSNGKHSMWRRFCTHVTLEEDRLSLNSQNHPSDDEFSSDASTDEALAQPLNNDELKSLIADSERSKLMKKLSEANQQNRFLKRQLYVEEDALVNFKSELAVIEVEIQALVNLTEEIAKAPIPAGTRKINGKYIQSHLLSRLQAVQQKVKEQIKDVEGARSKEVSLFWSGMAESVQVMGSFDGWSQGEHLSPEYTGLFTEFSTTLMLRPGRYEVKFLVDGEWKLSPELPTVGEGLMENNLLIVG
ncbi:hypothetical protein LguiA_014192 [Lonicera macranthoides]